MQLLLEIPVGSVSWLLGLFPSRLLPGCSASRHSISPLLNTNSSALYFFNFLSFYVVFGDWGGKWCRVWEGKCWRGGGGRCEDAERKDNYFLVGTGEAVSGNRWLPSKILFQVILKFRTFDNVHLLWNFHKFKNMNVFNPMNSEEKETFSAAGFFCE